MGGNYKKENKRQCKGGGEWVSYKWKMRERERERNMGEESGSLYHHAGEKGYIVQERIEG